LLFKRVSHSGKPEPNSQQHPTWAHENQSALNIPNFDIQDVVQEAKFLVLFVFAADCTMSAVPLPL
jgi:hypothetical protein